MRNKIMVLTDFSKSARNAILYAMAAFPPDGYDYVLLHVNPQMYVPGDVRMSVSEAMTDDAYKALEREAVLIRSHLRINTKFEKVAYLGFLNEAVNEVGKTTLPDLVVMGSHGETGRPAILGSNSTSLIKAINLPLLIVPSGAKFTGFSEIVFAADEKSLHHPTHLKPLAELAMVFGSKITVVNVIKDNDEDVESDAPVYEALDGIEVVVKHITDTTPEHGIAHYVHENPCDLLVMQERSRSFVLDLFHRSVTKNLALHTQTPLLILHG